MERNEEFAETLADHLWATLVAPNAEGGRLTRRDVMLASRALVKAGWFLDEEGD